MNPMRPNTRRRFAYELLLAGLLLLILNHISILADNPWLIPTFLRVH